jgi:hypothetical protein
LGRGLPVSPAGFRSRPSAPDASGTGYTSGMVRIPAALALAVLAGGCSNGANAFQCLPCALNSDCNKGTSCTEGYCVGPGEDPARCPHATTMASASAASSSGASSASGGSSGSSSASGGSSGSSASSSSTTGSTGSSASSSASSSSSGSTGSGGTTGPPNETCQTASPLPLGSTVLGNTGPARNDIAGPCGSSADLGPEVVFAFEPPATAMFALGANWLGADGGPVGGTPHVYAFSDCPAAQSCLLYDDVGPDRGLPLDQGVTAYLVVDSIDGGGPFALSVDYPNPNGHCASPELLALSPDGGAGSFSSSLYGSSDSSAPTCSNANGIDAVFELDAPSAQRYRFTVTPDVRLDVTLAGGTPCGNYDLCVETGGFGATEVLDTPALSASQPYFLLVDGLNNSKGNFTIQVEGLGP